MIKDIYDYGIIGDLYTAALIGKDGSMDWLCLPYLDSPSVFGFLLDADRGGRFAVEPAGPYDSTQTYLRQTNILQTDFRTGEGMLRLIDFMPVSEKNENATKRHEVYRIIEVLKGHATVRVLFEPMFDYAREAARFQTMGDAAIAAEGKNDRLMLSSIHAGLRIENDHVTAQWDLTAGERVSLLLKYNESHAVNFDFVLADQALHQTRLFWRNWPARTVNELPGSYPMNRFG